MDEQLNREVDLLHDRMCAAFQDPKRLLILYALAEKPRYVTELAELLELPQSTVSRHLKVLRDRSLVNTERQAQTVTYSLADPRVIEVLDTMRSIMRDVVLSKADLLNGREL